MMNHSTNPETSASNWKSLYKVGGVAALIYVVIIPIQSYIYIAFPPPTNAIDFFTLFQKNWLVGLLNRDLLLIVDNAILILVYLALYIALRRASESFMAIALAVGLVGIATYFPSNTAFEMFSLSSQYAVATTEMQRSMLLAAGQAMLAIYSGTAFNVYYILSAVALLIIAFIMLRSDIFSKTAAYFGLAAGLLMLIPSTAGKIGIAFSLASLIPWAVFCVLIARRFFQMK